MPSETRQNWRLISPGYNDAYTNMAIDEAILQKYIAGAVPPTLRVYGWKPDAISLGYFQKADEVLDMDSCQRQGVSFVRRITGGEAIFHSNDVSYSIICSKEDLALPKSIKSSFRVLASFLINAYKALGTKAYFSCEVKDRLSQRKRSSFCFASEQDFDILIGGKKLGGNAQKRLKNIIFQHGSVPLSLDIEKIKGFIREDLSGIENRTTALKNVLGKNISFDEFAFAIIDSFKKTFSVKLIEAELSPFELKMIEELRKEKYGCREWNLASSFVPLDSR